eukprot:gene15872-21269_t
MAADIMKYPASNTTTANYDGPDIECASYEFIYWRSYADCLKGVESIIGILAGCTNNACSNHGTCKANANLDDYVCTCSTPDLGVGWGGTDCELCNGAQPPTDPAADCDGVTLADCTKYPELQQVCPTAC